LRPEQLPNGKHSAAPSGRLAAQRAVQPHRLQGVGRGVGTKQLVYGTVIAVANGSRAGKEVVQAWQQLAGWQPGGGAVSRHSTAPLPS
jgi:hypothetical protein